MRREGLRVISRVRQTSRVRQLRSGPRHPITRLYRPTITRNENSRVPIRLRHSTHQDVRRTSSIRRHQLTTTQEPRRTRGFSLFRFRIRVLRDLNFGLVRPMSLVSPNRSSCYRVTFIFWLIRAVLVRRTIYQPIPHKQCNSQKSTY